MSEKIQPNYTDFGLSDLMQIHLRKIVEEHLINDLKFYGVNLDGLKFDWSESCIEGHHVKYLDSSVENYSGISVFDSKDNLIADGWMEFVFKKDYNLDGDFFLAYWEFITIWDGDLIITEKNKPGIPEHIWDKLPKEIKPNLQKDRINQL